MTSWWKSYTATVVPIKDDPHSQQMVQRIEKKSHEVRECMIHLLRYKVYKPYRPYRRGKNRCPRCGLLLR